ncbi:MAG: hypothetical protein MRZ90_06400 [Candidatus Gastranaerophilales bacterium]|nr:hypothetical protein [Candidatus Gastranaerophilales bacterium]
MKSTKMKYNELIEKLLITTKHNVTQVEIGNILNVSRQLINKRAIRNSTFSDDEIRKIEEFYNVDFKSNTNNNQIVITGNIMRIKVPKGTTLVVEYED